MFWSALRSASALKSRREPSAKATASRPSKSTGAGSRGASPAIQIARSLRSAGSLTPSTRFQATARPSAAVPTPADQLQTVLPGVIAGRLVLDAAELVLDHAAPSASSMRSSIVEGRLRVQT